ncbi:MAG TPA: hypothetical protein VKI64_09620 [Acidimicrobiales bacterium]|nr:hypothetical protein [Acidimicrobiales bacterium]
MPRAATRPAPERAGNQTDTWPSPGRAAVCTVTVEGGIVDPGGTVTAVIDGTAVDVVVEVTLVRGDRRTVLVVARGEVVLVGREVGVVVVA